MMRRIGLRRLHPLLLWMIPACCVIADDKAASVASEYIGTRACVQCHKDQYDSYRQTAHSVTVRLTDAATEPPPGVYDHPASGHRYMALHENSNLIHREIMRDAEGSEFKVTDVKLAYSFGSGTHAKTYLFAAGDYLIESPLTWYREVNDWRMSPNYDKPVHQSFHRMATSGCVFCHVGMIDRKDLNPYQFTITETTVGCERCHGPGQLHAKKHRADTAREQLDETIVNPGKLSRELGEAVCQQCHLQGAMGVAVSDKDEWDFRPGQPLTDFRVDYKWEFEDANKIVGHVDQLHQSACYQQTEHLTCVTCHHPHNPVAEAEKADFHRDTCLKCHATQGCSKPRGERVAENQNSCYECHMPKADTVVSHTALFNHRIGIHNLDPTDRRADGDASKISPILDVTHLSERERRRCDAIAKTDLLLRGRVPDETRNPFAIAAIGELVKLKETGQVDATADSKLAWLANMQGQPEIAKRLANEVLEKEKRPTLARIAAISLLGQLAFKEGDPANAVKWYRLAASYQYDAHEQYFLGLCEHNVGNADAAIAALKQSLKIDPLQPGAHLALSSIYEWLREPAQAGLHQEQAAGVTALLGELAKENR